MCTESPLDTTGAQQPRTPAAAGGQLALEWTRGAARFRMDQGGHFFQYLAAESDFFFLAAEPETGHITIANIVESSPIP